MDAHCTRLIRLKHPYDRGRADRQEEDAMTDAYIYDAIRTPRGKGRPDGALHEVTSGCELSAQ